MKVKTVSLILLFLFLITNCGGQYGNTTSSSNQSGTPFTGYVPGQKEATPTTSPKEQQPEKEHGIFFTVRDRDIEVPPDNTTIYEQNTFVFLSGDVEVNNIAYTISFTFMKAMSYPNSYDLVSGRIQSQNDAVFFYQEAVSGGTVKTIQKVKNGMLVIRKFSNVVEGSFWARIGLDDGEDLYISNGKINLEKK